MKINKIELVKISDLKCSPIKQEVLPDGFIERVIKYKEILKEVETISLEETVSNFQRDSNPENELSHWEKIAKKYETLIKDNPELGISRKKELLGKLIWTKLD